MVCARLSVEMFIYIELAYILHSVKGHIIFYVHFLSILQGTYWYGGLWHRTLMKNITILHKKICENKKNHLLCTKSTNNNQIMTLIN